MVDVEECTETYLAGAGAWHHRLVRSLGSEMAVGACARGMDNTIASPRTRVSRVLRRELQFGGADR